MSKFLPFVPISIIFILVFLLAFTNFTPNTFLTGWDNLHPEFNFLLNVKRLFFSWQEYQGLGLAPGMGHASDLPRVLFLWFMSLVLPPTSLRYFYHFLMLFLGAVGVYFLLKEIILEKVSASLNLKKNASLIGAVFYLFNLATLQMFYDPFEPFSHHFAALPSLFYANFKFIKEGSKKSLLFLFLINIFAIPQGYVATYFLVTVILLTISFLYIIYRTRQIKKIIIAYLMLFSVNAFWLLPNLYFLITKSNVNVNAKINQMSTENSFLENKKFGNLENTLLLKGFWFSNTNINKDGELELQMKNWIPYFNNPFIKILGFLLFTASFFGIAASVKKKNQQAMLVLPTFLLSFIMISNDTFWLSDLTSFLYKIPLFPQVFRFPFTKFSLSLAFSLSLFYALAFVYLSSLIRLKLFKLLLVIIFFFSPIIFMHPVFLGNFFDPLNKLAIPKSYFEVFQYFKNQEKSARIANFPQHSFWGWTFYSFGYRGSGILWYGLEQPVIDRAFDVWSRENENYYHEISYALDSNDLNLFEQVLEKYQINWLLLDNNVVANSSNQELYLKKLNGFINLSSKFNLQKSFDKISIYKVNLNSSFQQYVSLEKDLANITPLYNFNNQDPAFLEYGTYLSKENNENLNRVYYPFRSLFTGKDQSEVEVKIDDFEDYFLFSGKLPKSFTKGTLIIPQIKSEDITEISEEGETLKYPQIYLDNELVAPHNEETIFLPYIKDGKFQILIPKINGYESYDSSLDSNLPNLKTKACNPFNIGLFSKDEMGGGIFRFNSVNSNNCLDINLPNLRTNLGFLIGVNNRNLEGKSFFFSVDNLTLNRSTIQTYLPKTKDSTISYFIIPPLREKGEGYNLHFDNISIGRVKTVNLLGKITVNPIPYDFLSNIRVIKEKDFQPANQSSLVIEKVEHPNPSFYSISLNNRTIEQSSNETIVLSQSFDPGWKAYRPNFQFSIFNFQLAESFPFIFGNELKEHVLVNNWANGWLLENGKWKMENGKLIIIFWPQYLEYFGFLLLTVPILSVIIAWLLSKRNHKYLIYK